MVWWHPLVATFGVSIMPVIMLAAIPSLFGKGGQQKAVEGRRSGHSKKSVQEEPRLPLSLMMCFASGSLLADALGHLTERLSEGAVNWALTGILLFMLVDKLTRYSNAAGATKSPQKTEHNHSAGHLSLFGDALHNFTDGLAISASFGRGTKVGIATIMAILLHEIPHELGDYAVLAKAGYGHSRIIQLQLGTGAVAFAGALVGLAVSNGTAAATIGGGDWLLSFASGGFLYLGLCTILAEVMGDEERNGSKACILSDLAAFCLGVLVLRFLEG